MEQASKLTINSAMGKVYGDYVQLDHWPPTALEIAAAAKALSLLIDVEKPFPNRVHEAHLICKGPVSTEAGEIGRTIGWKVACEDLRDLDENGVDRTTYEEEAT